MTQIKKTLSIAGIIALATAPAMADIASTDYVQSIVNNMIPKTGTVGHVLKKTATGLEWAAAPTPTLETTTGTSTTASMTQKAITDALDAKAPLNSDGMISAEYLGMELDHRGDLSPSVGNEGQILVSNGEGIMVWTDGVLFNKSPEEEGMAIGNDVSAGDGGIAIAYGSAHATTHSIQLGSGTNEESYTMKVNLDDNYTLLSEGGVIPAGRLAGKKMTYDSWGDENGYIEDNGTAGQLLQTNGDGTMSWVDATASVLPALIDDCKVSGQRCALITTWNSTTQKPEYTWEVVKVNQ